MLIGLGGDAPAPWGAGEEAQLHEVGLVHILQGDRLLVDSGGQGLQAHRPAPVVLDDAPEHPVVDGVQSQVVDLQGGEGLVGHLLGDDAPRPHLGEVPHPPEHPVGDPRGAPGALGDLHGPVGLDGHLQDAGGPCDDEGELLRGVKLQP